MLDSDFSHPITHKGVILAIAVYIKPFWLNLYCAYENSTILISTSRWKCDVILGFNISNFLLKEKILCCSMTLKVIFADYVSFYTEFGSFGGKLGIP